MTDLLLALALAIQAPDSCAAILPLEAGRSWTYSGRSLWIAPGASRPDSGPVNWQMTIVGGRAVANGRIGLVRGFVQELAWYQPGLEPRLSILACRGAELRLATFADDSAAARAYAEWSDSLYAIAELWIALPLREGQVLGQDPGRNDIMYGWAVGRPESPDTSPASCRSGAPRYELTYRSLPDHRIVEWQPGLGVTRFVYAHHGPPASTDVRLVECGARREG
jgi:hypothetical protein